jgi:hypothetical protein
MRRYLLAALVLAPGCASNHPAVPETVTIKAGTAVRHEIGETPSRINTVAGEATWRLRK